MKTYYPKSWGTPVGEHLVMTRELKGSASWGRPLEGPKEEVWLGSALLGEVAGEKRGWREPARLS